MEKKINANSSSSSITTVMAQPVSNQSSRIGDYIYFSPAVGRGTFSKVFIGHHINCREPIQYVAIKRINVADMKKISLGRIQREIAILRALDHPNIVKFYEAFTDIANNIYIVTQFCNYGDLDRFTGKKSKVKKKKPLVLSPEEIKTYFTQFRDGLKYLLAHNILHRDIKPQNILLHKENGIVCLKICDFGFAKVFQDLESDEMMDTLCGTPMYLAPEIVRDKQYTITSDLWSIGVIMYELFFHTTPFKRPKNILELMRNLDELEDDDIPFPPDVNQDLENLLSDLLQIDPRKRINWGSFFTHEWFGDEADHVEDINDSVANMSSIYMSSNNLEKSVAVSCAQDLPLPADLEEMFSEARQETEATFHSRHRKDSLEDSLSSSISRHNPEYQDSDNAAAHLRHILHSRSHQRSGDEMEQSSRLFSNPNIIDNYTPSSTSVPTETRVGQIYGSPNIGTDRRFSSMDMTRRQESPDYSLQQPPDSPYMGSHPGGSRAITIPRKTQSTWGRSPVLRYLNNSLGSSMSYLGSLKLSESPILGDLLSLGGWGSPSTPAVASAETVKKPLKNRY